MGAASDLTVVCVYRPGNGFTDDYVTRLRDGVKKFCKAPHNFVCLTHQNLTGIECIPLTASRKGYWNKLEIFRKDLFDGPVVYLDLDTIIVEDITAMLTYPHFFTAGYNFSKKHGRSMASWFMGFNGCVDRNYLFDGYEAGTPDKYSQDWGRWGDQGYIQDNLQHPWTSIDELFPGCCASYKWEIRRPGFVPLGVCFVAFHGKPRPHQVNWELPNGN